MTAQASDAAGTERIGQFVEQHSGIVLGPEKAYLFASRLMPVMRSFGFAGLSDLAAQLRPGVEGELKDAVIDAMTTNETSWFRDGHPFDALRDHIVPDVIRRNARRRTLSVWSAASSTGQELYSVAMLLERHFPELAGWDVRLHGTDLSPAVVQRAHDGFFTDAEVARGLPPEMAARYLDRVGGGWQVKAALRTRCQFSERNLLEPWPREQYDIVMCRYVLIYFDVTVKAQVLAQIAEVTAPAGYLLLGGPETTVGVAGTWLPERIGRTPVYRNVAPGAGGRPVTND